jgi:hypothetical protein
MAIDTRNKRFSMLNLGQPIPFALFEADGTVDADDRAFGLKLYAGITLENPSGFQAAWASGSTHIVVAI